VPLAVVALPFRWLLNNASHVGWGGPLACGLCYARGKSTCKSNLFGSYKGDLNKDLRGRVT
jgi:hypothetical protein